MCNNRFLALWTERFCLHQCQWNCKKACKNLSNDWGDVLAEKLIWITPWYKIMPPAMAVWFEAWACTKQKTNGLTAAVFELVCKNFWPWGFCVVEIPLLKARLALGRRSVRVIAAWWFVVPLSAPIMSSPEVNGWGGVWLGGVWWGAYEQAF